MAASLVEQILARILVVLTGTTDAGTNVERARVDAIASEDLPAITIRRVGSSTRALTMLTTETTLDFDLDLFAHSETDVDALHVHAHAQLSADPGLAALAMSCPFNTGTESAGEGADTEVSRLTAHYEIVAVSTVADITQPA